MGTFIIPQSGVYLFIFRGNVTFPTKTLDAAYWRKSSIGDAITSDVDIV